MRPHGFCQIIILLLLHSISFSVNDFFFDVFVSTHTTYVDLTVYIGTIKFHLIQMVCNMCMILEERNVKAQVNNHK